MLGTLLVALRPTVTSACPLALPSCSDSPFAPAGVGRGTLGWWEQALPSVLQENLMKTHYQLGS